jgi:hypothetical protein
MGQDRDGEQGYAFGAQAVHAAKTQPAAPGIRVRGRLIWRCSGNYGQ